MKNSGWVIRLINSSNQRYSNWPPNPPDKSGQALKGEHFGPLVMKEMSL